MEEQRYYEQELNEQNILDLLKWIAENQLVAIVDEQEGGIIGYVSRNYSEEILFYLNPAKVHL